MNIQVSGSMQDALNKMSEGGFEQIGALLNDTRNLVRQELKKQTLAKMSGVINKLSGSDALTPEEIALIELWVVGDAESYTQLEDDLKEWIGEYKNLATTLSSYENKECAVNDLFKLLGQLEDASHVSFTLADYLEKKDRINNFKSAVAGGFDQEQRGYLRHFLNGKIHGEEY